MPPIVFERQPPSPALVDHALADSVNLPFWLDDAPPRPAHAALHGSTQAELAVVGGGFLGLWTAILAKERDPGRDVVLLEAQRIGHAASGRNGGFCEASITHGDDNAAWRWPDEVEQLERQGQLNLAEFEATLARHRIDCDFERNGLLEVAVEPHQDALLRGRPDYLDAAAVRAELASPTFLSGAWSRDGTALLHPGKLVGALARVAAECGVRLHEGSPVTALDEHGGGVRLRTAHGEVLAQQVVLATNAYPSLLGHLRRHTIPIYDYALMSEPLDAARMASIGWRHRQGVADLGNQFHYYRLTRDNRILFGGYDAIYHFGSRIDPALEDRAQTYAKLASHFFTTFPQLEGLRFTHRWAGVIDTSSRLCAFYAQAMGGRVAYAAGFTGLGVGATRFAANVLLDRLAGLDTERTRLRMTRELPMPFPPEPLRYAAVQAARWSLDRADHSGGRRNLFLRGLRAMGLGFDS